MSDAMREAFEARFPVPDGVCWDKEKYRPDTGWHSRHDKSRNTRLAKKHNKLFSVWQAALEHAGQGDRVTCQLYGYEVQGCGECTPPAPVMPEGVTRVNWQEHDGGAMPSELWNQPGVLVQFDNGAFSFRARSVDDWMAIVDCPTVARYTIIDSGHPVSRPGDSEREK